MQFLCQAIGVPVPYIRWYFNGVMVNLSGSFKYSNTSMHLNESIIESTLSIINAESSDVGTYTCEAKNIIGTEHSSGVLTVNGMYVHMDIILVINSYLVTLQHIITDAAEILEPLVERTEYIQEGENITVRCIGVGHPPPLVQWRKLNGLLSDRVSSNKMSLLANVGNITKVTVDLIYTGVHRNDTGIYECSVSNLLDDVARNITLILQSNIFKSTPINAYGIT